MGWAKPCFDISLPSPILTGSGQAWAFQNLVCPHCQSGQAKSGQARLFYCFFIFFNIFLDKSTLTKGKIYSSWAELRGFYHNAQAQPFNNRGKAQARPKHGGPDRARHWVCSAHEFPWLNSLAMVSEISYLWGFLFQNSLHGGFMQKSMVQAVPSQDLKVYVALMWKFHGP